jgi:glycosyltransferase involved in cell wall biosynthesis
VSPDPAVADGRRIALLFGSFRGGGVGTSFLRLAGELVGRGFAVDLVVGRRRGDLLALVPPEARVVELDRSSALAAYALALRADRQALRGLLACLRAGRQPSGKLRHLASFTAYLRRERPDAIIAATAPFNLVACWAKRLAGLSCPLLMSEHNRFAVEEGTGTAWRYDCPPALARPAYARAQALVAVSGGIAREMSAFAGVPPDRIVTVHNPAAGPHVAAGAAAPLDHPWFAPGQPPVVLGVGMLKPQKDFPTLVRAFARVRAGRPARLVILGDTRGDKDHGYAEALRALPGELGIAEHVAFPGFVDNPFAWMARAGCFVLASRWEGLGNVVIEALAAGCPVVSTDCPSGPAEILAGGTFGRLVPVGDDAAMAEAIAATLDAPPRRADLQARAGLFTAAGTADRYLELLFPAGA